MKRRKDKGGNMEIVISDLDASQIRSCTEMIGQQTKNKTKNTN